MREVIQHHGVDLSWTEDLSVQLNGYVDGNFICIPEELQSGTCYAIKVNEYISVYVTDVTYNTSMVFRYRNKSSDFVTLHYDFTEGNAVIILNEELKSVGRWAYNEAFVDSCMDVDYEIKKGSKVYSITIFILKEEIKRQLSFIPQFDQILGALFDPEQNTFIRFSRGSNRSWWIADELRKANQQDPLYETLLKGIVYSLLSEYMDGILTQEILIEKVSKEDLVGIIESQSFLIAALRRPFPGIKELSARACMSETKYKTLFKKITGNTANSFFLENKLFHAREMLETGLHTISEVADHFNFTTASHFTDQFKNLYNVPPKDYLNHF
ncbi:helix-turn-helix domain-containing protein [Pedobacter alluvionis]|uniref:AraC family transcriptional regulator n=1 Tax=Pedobacter alluvionis TaxID=475253 RepID=A0A497YB09_9SPHI|nr:AraC family transcriptional regulator [Pedobacter alluvionis]RLJ79656.1 AraC-like DNA-binding protein [Pedobacter alluvionis]TFB30982.1 AraC family transcriptional regulator [Pedobacter alluvionis]